METRFAKISGLNALHLRAGYFMENTLPQVGILQQFGMMAGPVNGELKLPMIATRDIGAAAADALLRLNFTGQQTRELLGQRDISYNEVARIVGEAIGRPALAYIQLPAEQVIMAMVQMGISKNVAGLVCEMADAMNSGYMKPLGRERLRIVRRLPSRLLCKRCSCQLSAAGRPRAPSRE
jgi:uncharacterized protein YbjT (DUF2867 family)